MIDLFHNMLANLANDPSNNFILIDTRSTLTRNASQPIGWANEIHPWYQASQLSLTSFWSA